MGIDINEMMGGATAEMDAIKDLKAEFDSLKSDDPRKAELHRQISEAATPIRRMLNNLPEGIGGDIKRQFIADTGGESFFQGSPEFTEAAGKFEASSTLATKMQEGEEKSTAALEQGMESIKAGAQEAKDIYAEGEAKTLSAIESGKEAAGAEITAGEKKIGDLAVEGGEELTQIGKDAETSLTDISAEAGQKIGETAQTAAGSMRTDIQSGVSDAQGQLDPYNQAGVGALGKQQTLLGIGEGGMEGAQAALEATPGYQFNLQQGLAGIQSGAAARGGTLGGRALKELQTRGAGIASQTYNTTLAQLGQVAGRGQQAASTMAGIGMQGTGMMNQATQFGAQGEMMGTEFAAQGAMRGTEVGAQYGAMGTQMATGGQMDASRFGAAGRAGIEQQATGQEIAAMGMSTAGRAGTTMSGANAAANIHSQQASTVANIYGTQATVGAQMETGSAQYQANMQWQRMEAQLAKDMASWSSGQALFGDLLGVAGAVGGAYVGGL